MSLESTIRTQLLTNSSITAIVGSRIFVGDTPSKYIYPFIRIGNAGSEPGEYRLKNRRTKTIAIDIFAEHNADLKKYGYSTLDSIFDAIRIQFEGFELTRLTDTDHSYDVLEAEYREYSTRKNSAFNDVHLPTTLTIIYNII